MGSFASETNKTRGKLLVKELHDCVVAERLKPSAKNAIQRHVSQATAHSKVTSNDRVHQLMQLRTLNLSNALANESRIIFKIRRSVSFTRFIYDIFIEKLKEHSEDI